MVGTGYFTYPRGSNFNGVVTTKLLAFFLALGGASRRLSFPSSDAQGGKRRLLRLPPSIQGVQRPGLRRAAEVRWQTGETTAYDPGGGRYSGEAVFVARPGSCDGDLGLRT